jgi:hypothetical protein
MEEGQERQYLIGLPAQMRALSRRIHKNIGNNIRMAQHYTLWMSRRSRGIN